MRSIPYYHFVLSISLFCDVKYFPNCRLIAASLVCNFKVQLQSRRSNEVIRALKLISMWTENMMNRRHLYGSILYIIPRRTVYLFKHAGYKPVQQSMGKCKLQWCINPPLLLTLVFAACPNALILVLRWMCLLLFNLTPGIVPCTACLI